MRTNLIKRSITDLIIVFFILNGWWFLALPVCLFAGWIFPYFIEIILAGIIYDSLFGLSGEPGIFGYYGLMITIVVFAIISGLKTVVRK